MSNLLCLFLARSLSVPKSSRDHRIPLPGLNIAGRMQYYPPFMVVMSCWITFGYSNGNGDLFNVAADNSSFGDYGERDKDKTL